MDPSAGMDKNHKYLLRAVKKLYFPNENTNIFAFYISGLNVHDWIHSAGEI